MQFGPSPQTQEYSRPSPCCVPPAQWGNHYARESGDKNVNCLAMYLQAMKRILWDCQKNVKGARMSFTMHLLQACLILWHLI